MFTVNVTCGFRKFASQMTAHRLHALIRIQPHCHLPKQRILWFEAQASMCKHSLQDCHQSLQCSKCVFHTKCGHPNCKAEKELTPESLEAFRKECFLPASRHPFRR
jgi:hypothetical protein